MNPKPFDPEKIVSDLTSGEDNKVRGATAKTVSNLDQTMGEVVGGLDRLDEQIEKFSHSTDNLAGEANTLTEWFVVLTAVIAIAAIADILLRLKIFTPTIRF